jgi:hypothetical protein
MRGIFMTVCEFRVGQNDASWELDWMGFLSVKVAPSGTRQPLEAQANQERDCRFNSRSPSALPTGASSVGRRFSTGLTRSH